MLFNNTAELQKYTGFVAMNFAAIEPVLNILEEDCLVPYLGKELYESLLTKMEAGDVADDYKKLEDLCKKIIAPFAVFKYIPKGQLQISQNGVQRAENADLKTPFGYQITELKEAYLSDGEMAIERLLSFLEANKASFSDWTDSAAYKEYNSLIIRSGSEFKDLFSMQATPHRNYWAMRSKMQDVQFHVRTSLGSEAFDELLTDQKEGDLDASKADQLTMVKKAVVYFTIAQAVPYLNCRMEANGITMLSNIVATSQKDGTNRMAANDKAISNLIISAQKDGEQWMSMAKELIKELNPSVPTPTNSGCDDYKSIFSF